LRIGQKCIRLVLLYPREVYCELRTASVLMLAVPGNFLKESSDGSRHQQLREQLRQAILDGRLASGTWLPSTRALAQTLGVSRTVTSSAYDELFAEGYLEGRQGSGT